MDGGIRVLLSTGPFLLTPLARTFEIAAEAGFEGVEVAVTQDRETQSAERLRGLSEEFGLVIPVLHGPFLLFTRWVWGADPKGKIDRCIDLAEEAGISVVVIHPPYRWQIRYGKWLAGEMARMSAEGEVTVAVENMFPLRWRGRGVRVHRWTETDRLKRFPHLVLDTSHLAVSGRDIIEAFDDLHDRVAHIHLSNNSGKGRDSHSPLHQGVLPIGEFLTHVAASGYQGTITLELNIRPYVDQRDRLIALLEESRHLCLERLRMGVGSREERE